MKLVLGLDFDRGVWPGPLVGRDAVAGEAWVGPLGFLDMLETALGLGGRYVPDAVRAVALVPALRGTEGFWSRSAEADPTATAKRLLHWRDELFLGGWRGEAVSARWEQLASVTAGVLPGIADRIAAVGETLARRDADLAELEVFDRLALQAEGWRTVLDRLAARGTVVRDRVLTPSAARGDLAAARCGGFAPHVDGSLQLFRAWGPLQAAEEVAAWVAGLDERAGLVVIGGDAVLDDALRRHGLPTLGGDSSALDNAVLQVLPLVLAMGWSPPDPQRALELLILETSPVPRGIASRLARALHDWPAVDSDVWRAGLDDGLKAIEDGERRDNARERIDAVFRPSATGDGMPAAEVRRRIALVETWLRWRLDAQDADGAKFGAAMAQCAELSTYVDLAGIDPLTPPLLDRLVQDATAIVACGPRHPARAGLTAVRSPGAVVGPAKTIVWWDFVRDCHRAAPTMPMTNAERQAFAAAGIALRDAAAEAIFAAERARRPLLAATDTLLCVCPARGADGEDAHPHVLWDEIAARIDEPRRVARLEVRLPATPAPGRVSAGLSLPPSPRRDWVAAAGRINAKREKESPSGAGRLVGCSFSWVLQYVAGVQGGDTAVLPRAEELLGRLAHEMLRRLLGDGNRTPEEAETEAHRLFDAEGPRLAAPLFLPGSDAERARARIVTGSAARRFFALLRDGNRTVVAVETSIESEAFGTRFDGQPDVVLGDAPSILDFKWSGSNYRRSELEKGVAYQLAAYARLVGKSQSWPPVAYFILAEQRLLSTDPAAFPGAERMFGPGPEATWRALERAYDARRAELAAGSVLAPGNPNAAGDVVPGEHAVDTDGRLVLTAPCMWCSFSPLCGRSDEVVA